MTVVYGNHMAMSDSLEEARNWAPRAEWEDLRGYVLLSEFEEVIETLKKASPDVVKVLEIFDNQAALRAKLDIAVKALSDALNGVNREECFKVYKELKDQVGKTEGQDT